MTIKESKFKFYNFDMEKVLKKERIEEIFQSNGNTVCFDCHNKSNKVTSVHTTFAVFLCCECAKHHKRFFEEFEDRILNIEKTKFNNFELNLLENGGNDRLEHFLKDYSINHSSTDVREKYLNQAVLFYRRWLLNIAEGKDIKSEKPSKKEATGPVEIEEFLELEKEGDLLEHAENSSNNDKKNLFGGINEHTVISDERQHERPIRHVKGGEVRSRLT